MKQIYITILLIVCTFSKMSSAEGVYIGIDLNNLQFEQPEFEATPVYSITAGYDFNRWAIEGSYNYSQTDNNYFGGDQTVNMYHLYGVYRSVGTYYYKVKLGLTNEKYKFLDDTDKVVVEDIHTGIARGVGVGYRYGHFNIELEYSWLGGSLEMIGVGIKYKFNTYN